MSYLFKDLAEEASRYSGKCADSEQNKRFTMRVIERFASRNGGDFIGYWRLVACNQIITAPRDLLKVTKVKINGKVSRAWSNWYSFYDYVGDEHGFIDCVKGIHRIPGTYCVAYDPPRPGFRIIAQPLVQESEDSHFLLEGIDIYNRVIFREKEKQIITGEYLSIVKETASTLPKATRSIFKELKSVYKTPTKNLVRLIYFYEDTKEGFFGAEYLPNESIPEYSRYRINDCPMGNIDIEILGQIKIPSMYNEYDKVPINSIDIFNEIAQEIMHSNNNELNSAAYKRQSSSELIQQSNTRKEEGDESLDFVFAGFTAGSEEF